MLDQKTIRASFDREVARLAETVLAFPWHRRDAYAGWAAQSYYFVEHTSTLLTLMASKFGPRHPERFRAALLHLREETNHEDLLINDLKALGHKLEQFPELVESSMMYQSQYYWVERCGPLSITGFSLLLEGLATTAGQQIYDIVAEKHGKAAGTFLRVHTAADASHYKNGLDSLKQLGTEDLRNISLSLTQCGTLYRSLLAAVLKQADTVVPMKKAA